MTISATTQGLRMGVATSSSRPAVPFDGQVISETDTDLLKVYNGTSWVTVGPPTTPTTAFTSGQQSTSSTSYVALTTATAVTVTTGTTALLVATASLEGTTASSIQLMSFAISGATTVAASDNFAAIVGQSTAVASRFFATLVYYVTGLTAGSNTFSLQYRGTAGTTYGSDRRILVFPL